MVFQSYALFPNMTVAGNIGYGLRCADRRRRARGSGVASCSTMMQLDGFGDRRVDQLSGGQRQRVALARALAVGRACCCSTSRSPRSTRSCANSLRVEIDQLLRSLGITAVYVTHDQARGDGARRPHRGDGAGARRADRHAAGDLLPAGDRVRRRLHRHDEPVDGRVRRRPVASAGRRAAVAGGRAIGATR